MGGFNKKSPSWVKRGLGELLYLVQIDICGTNPSNLPLS